ncbi:Tudor/PWWP/MBT superfamily protein [Forsythia ovata]|uniref:Tudor/PWWP/MBT superfamily protein n=1 Tax=Forsythia ovata TaxID=205694 RepID=A0ABD1X9I5_9LAMI
MNLILEESGNLSRELLTLLLVIVKKNSHGVVTIHLVERVFEKCVVKLKSYLTKIIKSLGVYLDDYSAIVSSVCNETNGTVDQNNNITYGDELVAEIKSASAFPDLALVTY